MIRVVFVCLGNICRSPLAEGIFAKLVADAHLSHAIEADSVGVAGQWHAGQLPDERAIRVAAENGIELMHKARLILDDDFRHSTYLVAMDYQNHTDLQFLQKRVKGHQAQIILMRDFDDIDTGAEVPDPYYGEYADFKATYAMLQRACAGLLDFLRQQHDL